MNKFKIVLEGIIDEEDDNSLSWEETIIGDRGSVTTVLSAELIMFTMKNGMNKEDFMKQIKEHYDILEKEYLEMESDK